MPIIEARLLLPPSGIHWAHDKDLFFTRVGPYPSNNKSKSRPGLQLGDFDRTRTAKKR